MNCGAQVVEPVIGGFAVRTRGGANIPADSKKHAEQICAALETAYQNGHSDRINIIHNALDTRAL